MNDREMLKMLVKYGESFRSTPIVDDDFPRQRNRFDRMLRDASRYLSEPKPTVVCLCGSTRFVEAYATVNREETLAGRIVLSVGAFKSDELTVANKVSLDQLRFRKIDMADEVFVINAGGYIGTSTAREIDYAEQQNKKIRYLEQPKQVDTEWKKA